MDSGYDISRVLFNTTSYRFDAFNGITRGGFVSTNSLVLDSEKEELVKSPRNKMNGEKKMCDGTKTLMALKSHREAERRRRSRINGHHAKLRGLVSCPLKMDKATLLAEVVRQVKELKKNANEESKGYLIPKDSNEVKVEIEQCESGGIDGSILYKASICCEYGPELLSDLKKTLDTLQLDLVRAEFNVHHALTSVLDKASASMDYELKLPPRPCMQLQHTSGLVDTFSDLSFNFS
ncbi:putative transcription factor bHLH107 [Vicia villosa]|uniref:putative transcription factor bHLH107 n=1 Tax=Vicia villosa TaxID=3911 RepID=UPI00273B259B|nr:putative transcription factor bHLH107 [Vicia villosa]